MERFKLVASVHLLLVRDGKILLLRRFNTGYEDGNYSVPAGHIDGNEPVRKAMCREALEEAGLTLQESDLQFSHVMHRSADKGTGAGSERIDFFFTTELHEEEPKNTEPDKCDELAWFDLDNLPA